MKRRAFITEFKRPPKPEEVPALEDDADIGWNGLTQAMQKTWLDELAMGENLGVLAPEMSVPDIRAMVREKSLARQLFTAIPMGRRE